MTIEMKWLDNESCKIITVIIIKNINMINEREITMEQLPQVGFMKSFVLFWKIMLILRRSRR